MSTPFNVTPHPAHLALGRGGGHLAQILLVFAIGGVLCQLIEDVRARRLRDVQVVRESRAIGGGAGKRVFFIGLLWKKKQTIKPYFDRLKRNNPLKVLFVIQYTTMRTFSKKLMTRLCLDFKDLA